MLVLQDPVFLKPKSNTGFMSCPPPPSWADCTGISQAQAGKGALPHSPLHLTEPVTLHSDRCPMSGSTWKLTYSFLEGSMQTPRCSAPWSGFASEGPVPRVSHNSTHGPPGSLLLLRFLCPAGIPLGWGWEAEVIPTRSFCPDDVSTARWIHRTCCAGGPLASLSWHQQGHDSLSLFQNHQGLYWFTNLAISRQ